MIENRQKERILIVTKDAKLRADLVGTLEEAGGYMTNQAGTFEEALSEILLVEFDLVITEAYLPDLSGIDLLTATASLCPVTRVIVVDDALSAKSAMAAFRMGAVDYMHKPLNMSFVLMQVERQLEIKRRFRAYRPQRMNAEPAVEMATPQRPPEKRANPVSLTLGRQEFKRIHVELNRLLTHVRATFVGLVDVEGNMIGAAGKLDDYDLQLLTRALSMDHKAQKSLASILDESKFHSTYFEGNQLGVYIIEFGLPHTVLLAVICDRDVKPGMVWLYSKRAAAIIDEVLSTVPAATGATVAVQTPSLSVE